jgi:hypothetical protein
MTRNMSLDNMQLCRNDVTGVDVTGRVEEE